MRDGSEALRAREYHKADDLFRQVLAMEPNKGGANFLAGNSALQLELHPNAIAGAGTGACACNSFGPMRERIGRRSAMRNGQNSAS